MKRKPIDLIIEEYVNIKNNYKCLGSGVDGSVYKVSADTVFKFYHKDDSLISIPNAQVDEDGVIINDFRSLRPFNKVERNEGIYYTDEDGVILSRNEAINRAIDKQANVHLTDLPKNSITLNRKVIGCTYKYCPYKFGIYASAYLPLKQRLIVCKRLIEKVKELLDNNIYPVTLSQRDELFPFRKNYSNVLIGTNLDPAIVDLDGISAMYTESFSSKYYDRTLGSLTALVLELLSRVELANNIDDDEFLINEKIMSMEKAGIPEYFSVKFFDECHLDLEDLDSIIKTLELRKK